MRYRILASYRGAPYEAGIGPNESDVVLFAACPPPEDLRFEPATGHWRKSVNRVEVQALYESRPVGMFRGERCVVLDELADRLHIAYLGHDGLRATQLGYWEVDRGVFELVTPRQEVTEIVEQRLVLQARSESGEHVRPAVLPTSSTGWPEVDNGNTLATGPRTYDWQGGSDQSAISLPAVAEPPLPLEAEALRATAPSARRGQKGGQSRQAARTAQAAPVAPVTPKTADQPGELIQAAPPVQPGQPDEPVQAAPPVQPGQPDEPVQPDEPIPHAGATPTASAPVPATLDQAATLSQAATLGQAATLSQAAMLSQAAGTASLRKAAQSEQPAVQGASSPATQPAEASQNAARTEDSAEPVGTAPEPTEAAPPPVEAAPEPRTGAAPNRTERLLEETAAVAATPGAQGEPPARAPTAAAGGPQEAPTHTTPAPKLVAPAAPGQTAALVEAAAPVQTAAPVEPTAPDQEHAPDRAAARIGPASAQRPAVAGADLNQAAAESSQVPPTSALASDIQGESVADDTQAAGMPVSSKAEAVAPPAQAAPGVAPIPDQAERRQAAPAVGLSAGLSDPPIVAHVGQVQATLPSWIPQSAVQAAPPDVAQPSAPVPSSIKPGHQDPQSQPSQVAPFVPAAVVAGELASQNGASSDHGGATREPEPMAPQPVGQRSYQAQSGAHAAGLIEVQAASARRRRATKRRLPTQKIFSDLAAQAAIPAAAYAIGEDVDGAMCLVRTDEGFEVFNAAGGSRHEVRVFQDEESAYFYLFGVLVADAVRMGALIPRD